MAYLTHRMPLAIAWAHCDPAGIVWNPRFFEFFDTATWQMFETTLGVPKEKLFERFGIVGIPLVESGANFSIALKFGDAAEIVSTVAEFRRSSFHVRHQIMKDGKLAVDGLEKRVWAGRDPGDAARLRAIALPGEVIEKFRAK